MRLSLYKLSCVSNGIYESLWCFEDSAQVDHVKTRAMSSNFLNLKQTWFHATFDDSFHCLVNALPLFLAFRTTNFHWAWAAGWRLNKLGLSWTRVDNLHVSDDEELTTIYERRTWFPDSFADEDEDEEVVVVVVVVVVVAGGGGGGGGLHHSMTVKKCRRDCSDARHSWRSRSVPSVKRVRWAMPIFRVYNLQFLRLWGPKVGDSTT